MTRKDEKTRSKEYETPEPKAKCKNPPLLPFQNGAKKEPLRIKAAAGSEMGSSQMHDKPTKIWKFKLNRV